MKIIYFDCFSGISGDMALGALIDAGVPKEFLVEQLRKIPDISFAMDVKAVKRSGISATDVTVEAPEEGKGRSLTQILSLLKASSLEEGVKSSAEGIFRLLAEAEARVHAVPVEEIHFHELGGIDAIVDIVGTALGVRYLGAEELFCSPLPPGRGMVKCAHGTLPVPAPAVAEILKGLPTGSNPPLGTDSAELVTPTGAAIVASLCAGFGDLPPMKVEAVGYGAGKRELDAPNLLRIFLGEAAENEAGVETDTVALLEANIDDMNPEFYPHLMEQALEMGAFDVFISPVIMKKGRPGQLLTILCPPDESKKFATLLFQETTTFGIRISHRHRFCLRRQTRKVETPFGPIAIKVAFLGEEVVQASPEFRDCQRAAEQSGAPLKEVYAAAIAAFSKADKSEK
jgi:hypothetical protein